MVEKKKDWVQPAWMGAIIFLFLIILEVLLIEVDAGVRVPILSPLLDHIRRNFENLLEMLRV